jgi:ABC-type transport system involved in multi-copper enzyme maturation permease subunit
MSGPIAAEYLKVRTTRSVAYTGLPAIALVVFVTGALMTQVPEAELVGPLDGLPFFTQIPMFVALFPFIVGIRGFTDEFRHSTMVGTVVATPRRGRIVIGKAVVSGVSGVLIGALAGAVFLGIAVPALTLKGVSFTVSPESVRLLAAFAAVCGLWAVIGVGLGALVRSQVAAIVGAILWVLALENFAAAIFPDAARYLPGKAAQALSQIREPWMLTPWPAAAVFAGYALVVLLVGAAALQRRDVS